MFSVCSSVRDSFISGMLKKEQSSVNPACRRWSYEDIKEAHFMRFLLEVRFNTAVVNHWSVVVIFFPLWASLLRRTSSGVSFSQIYYTVQIYEKYITIGVFFLRKMQLKFSWRMVLHCFWCLWTKTMSVLLKGGKCECVNQLMSMWG